MSEGNGRNWSAEIKELGDKIVALTLGKAVELGDYMEQVHGIKAAVGGGGGGGGAVAAAAPAAAAEAPAAKTEFTVMLEGLADTTKKISVIKVVREVTGCGLAEGKTMVESAPKAIKENISKDDAEAIKKKLEDAGAKVSLK
jgi:large subunit ribosomal protein L7/L12